MHTPCVPPLSCVPALILFTVAFASTFWAVVYVALGFGFAAESVAVAIAAVFAFAAALAAILAAALAAFFVAACVAAVSALLPAPAFPMRIQFWRNSSVI